MHSSVMISNGRIHYDETKKKRKLMQGTRGTARSFEGEGRAARGGGNADFLYSFIYSLFSFPIFIFPLILPSSDTFGGQRAGGFDLAALRWHPSVEAHVYTSIVMISNGQWDDATKRKAGHVYHDQQWANTKMMKQKNKTKKSLHLYASQHLPVALQSTP